MELVYIYYMSGLSEHLDYCSVTLNRTYVPYGVVRTYEHYNNNNNNAEVIY